MCGSSARSCRIFHHSQQVAHESAETCSAHLRSVTRGKTHGISQSRLMAQDSDLQDFDTPGKDQLESDTDDGGDNVPGVNAGVLGMLYQFSKAQTEKGTGVNI